MFKFKNVQSQKMFKFEKYSNVGINNFRNNVQSKKMFNLEKCSSSKNVQIFKIVQF
jgi:hypothetical protein